MPPPFTATLLAFRKAAPGVRLVLDDQVSTQQIEALLERRLHIGIVRSPAMPDLPDALAAIELHREPWSREVASAATDRSRMRIDSGEV